MSMFLVVFSFFRRLFVTTLLNTYGTFSACPPPGRGKIYGLPIFSGGPEVLVVDLGRGEYLVAQCLSSKNRRDYQDHWYQGFDDVSKERLVGESAVVKSGAGKPIQANYHLQPKPIRYL